MYSIGIPEIIVIIVMVIILGVLGILLYIGFSFAKKMFK
jgi:hypothetical protein